MDSRLITRWAAGFALVLVAGCGGGGSNTGDCTPGQSAGCVCTNGEMGAQVCQDDRTFGACTCNAPVDAAVPIDASEIDASEIDASEIDASEIDAAPQVTSSGSIWLFETATLNPGTSGTFFGQGVRMSIRFALDGSLPGPLVEETPGSPLGCKVWEYTPPQAAMFALGTDQGPIQVSSPAGSGASLLPECRFNPNSGYGCPHLTTVSTGGIIAAGPQAGTATLTDLDVTYNAMNTTNRHIAISGATNPGNNGVFPILAIAGANTIVYGNPAVIAETLSNIGAHVNLAGLGATPGAPDPGFLDDAASLEFVHTGVAMGDIGDFTSTTTAGGSVGNDFTLATAELNKLNAIPTNGSEFTIACDASECPAGSASATVLEIITTDGPTAGLSPFAMPSPTSKQLRLRCMGLGVTSITVPAAYSAYVMNSGATRMEATFYRATLMGGGPANVSSASGHAIVGYTN